MKTTSGTESLNDVQLVERSRGGDRDAFGRIVERYQSLICALTYSACGNLQASEDLAQVTFITAWCELPKLKEPSRLKSWLCGIARNLANNSFRQDKRTPTANAEELDVNVSADANTPRDHVISKEEEAILWRSLSELPVTYREPLVLFYRQKQSVADVADALGVSEDVVRQRLSRGRTMLTEKVTAFVEGALGQTTPGTAFTLSVLAALPVMTTSAKAAVIGAAAAKGSATAKTAAATGLFSAILIPFLIIFGNYASYRMNMDGAQTDSERDHIKGFYRRLIACLVGFGIVLTPLILWVVHERGANSLMFSSLFVILGASYAAALVWFAVWSFRKRRAILADFATKGIRPMCANPAWEYRSGMSLLGLPIVHIRLGGGVPVPRRIVKAWIAAGDCAFGGCVAFGGVAIAPVSIGGVAIGLLPFGGLAIGLLALGGFGIGVWTYGGLALGWQAFGGCAIAWNAAYGGCAIAREFALGGFAQAAQANNAVARQFMESIWFSHFSQACARHSVLLNLIWLVPMLLCWRVVSRQANRRN